MKYNTQLFYTCLVGMILCIVIGIIGLIQSLKGNIDYTAFAFAGVPVFKYLYFRLKKEKENGGTK